MGLDNGFLIKKENDSNFKLEIAYFRKFYELDDFIRSRSEKINDLLFKVDYEVLKELKEELQPTINVLIQIPERLLHKYDDSVCPKKYKLDSDDLIHDEFNPVTTSSAFAGWKAIKLYTAVCTMINFLDDNKGYYIEFYSSY